MPIKLFFTDGAVQVVLTQRDISLVFAAAAVTAFLVAYFSLALLHRDFAYYRYSVFLGMPPFVYATARFILFLLLSGTAAGEPQSTVPREKIKLEKVTREIKKQKQKIHTVELQEAAIIEKLDSIERQLSRENKE